MNTKLPDIEVPIRRSRDQLIELRGDREGVRHCPDVRYNSSVQGLCLTTQNLLKYYFLVFVESATLNLVDIAFEVDCKKSVSCCVCDLLGLELLSCQYE